jgi:hypothetical protein
MIEASKSPTAQEQGRDTQDVSSWRAVADWYHAYFTGILLSTITRRGTPRATELVEAIFSRQREERFVAGLAKLGLDKLPHAVAAAQYHYLSNHIGGVSVEYMYESDRKAWVRYPAPRWIWAGTAMCAIPTEVSRAMLAGWHAQNGMTLGNKRLGFVCTKMAVDGQSALEGYYYEYDHDLAPQERLRFARNEDAPDFDADKAPQLPITTWPPTRLAKAHRNYAMEYVRTTLPVALNLWGPEEAVPLLNLSAKLIGMQFYHQTSASLGLSSDKSAASFAQFIKTLAAAQDDICLVTIGEKEVRVSQQGWTLMDDVQHADASVMRAWNGLLEGALAAHNHRLSLDSTLTKTSEGFRFEWIIR